MGLNFIFFKALMKSTSSFLSPVQTDAALLANNSQHCWMLHVASVCTPCCMLLDVVACCCAKFETSQTFQPTTPSQCWIRCHALITHGLQRLMGCILPTMHCPNIVGSCCIRLPTRTQQLLTLLAQQSWELLRPVCTQPQSPN